MGCLSRKRKKRLADKKMNYAKYVNEVIRPTVRVKS